MGIIKVFAGLIVLVLVLVAISAGWMRWEVGKLRTLCSDIRPGTPIDSIPQVLERHGFNRHWGERGVREKNGAGWVTFVPASSTMGDVVCAIRYDGKTVVSSEMHAH